MCLGLNMVAVIATSTCRESYISLAFFLILFSLEATESMLRQCFFTSLAQPECTMLAGISSMKRAAWLEF
jgi:hypothetical protein